ncbi:hypothetical protein Pint_31053 [Pistacia integerrima]|uniref:Uncharacterized protein n=1 Tax=Pistacia integerrima TaxID=434235 RepID=A0ACC0XNM8_9ROSI|nr:hypothetical protein Pint_31053 [Pistacia integerrima]
MERVAVAGGPRRAKWQYPQAQQTPRILQLPRRPRKKVVKSGGKAGGREKRGRLEVLFDQEREFSRGVVREVVVVSEEERRGRVEESGGGEGGRGGITEVEEEKWRFQAEMLRAECNLLRIEREVAVKKMERRRVQVERILRSAIHTLVSGRSKICSGEDVSIVLENEIMHLTQRLEKLQRRSGVKYLEGKKCSNFDEQASLLQRRLVKVEGKSDEMCVKEISEMAVASLSIQTSCRVDESSISNENCHVEILRRKMEGLSKGMLLERMEEEYGSMPSTATSSASTSKRIEFPEMSSVLVWQPYKVKSQEEKKCSGHCKAIVRRIVEQVRAETEQWSQMQEMLGQVRDEIEELQASRDFWEDRAINSDYQIQSLVSAVQEWKQKAVSSEAKADELQAQVAMLQKKIERLRKEQDSGALRAETSSPLARESQNETEKRVLICRLKENHRGNDNVNKQREALNDGRRKARSSSNALVSPKRSPLQDIGNQSLLTRQNSRAIFPLHSNAESRF